MRLETLGIQRVVAVFFFCTAVVVFLFISLHSLKLIELELSQREYFVGWVEIVAGIFLSIGLLRGKRWSSPAAMGYIAIVSICLVIETILTPTQMWTPLVLGLMLMVNGMILLLLCRTLSPALGAVLLWARRLAEIVFIFGVFFFLTFVFNFLIAAFFLISVTVAIRFGAQATRTKFKRPDSV